MRRARAADCSWRKSKMPEENPMPQDESMRKQPEFILPPINVVHPKGVHKSFSVRTRVFSTTFLSASKYTQKQKTHILFQHRSLHKNTSKLHYKTVQSSIHKIHAQSHEYRSLYTLRGVSQELLKYLLIQ